jgi:sugar (pentulose or hexulose) kinase
VRRTGAFVGVDVGTTFIKAVVADDELQPRGVARVATPWSVVGGRTEAAPTSLRDAAWTAIEQAIAEWTDAPTVAAVGIVSMGETGVAIDGAGVPTWPAIPWHDPTGRELTERLRADLGDQFAAVAGRPPTELCSVVKWRALAQAHPDRRPRRWLSAAEWVAWSLGARPDSEGSLLSRTGALRVGSGALFDDALAWSGVPSGFVTTPVPAGTPAGRATEGPRGVRSAVVSVCGLDCYAAATDVGATDQATVFLSCGTSGAAIRVLDGPVAGERIAAAVARDLTVDRFVDARRLVLLGASPCGLTLQPVWDEHGPPPPPKARPSSGARERGAADDWQDGFRAVASGQGTVMAALEAVAGPVERYVGAGGWLRFAGLRQALEAAVRPIEVQADRELAALGAARMARASLAG